MARNEYAGEAGAATAPPHCRGPPYSGITSPEQGKNEAGPTCSDIGPADHGSNPWVSLIVMP
jgi:hypothetical protein